MMRILVADDNPYVLKAVCGFLRASGHATSEVSDGIEVIEQLESGEKFDLVITDYRMKSLNGDKVLKKIREDVRWKELPVIVFSGDISEEIEDRVRALGGFFARKGPLEGLRSPIERATLVP